MIKIRCTLCALLCFCFCFFSALIFFFFFFPLNRRMITYSCDFFFLCKLSVFFHLSLSSPKHRVSQSVSQQCVDQKIKHELQRLDFMWISLCFSCIVVVRLKCVFFSAVSLLPEIMMRENIRESIFMVMIHSNRLFRYIFHFTFSIVLFSFISLLVLLIHCALFARSFCFYGFCCSTFAKKKQRRNKEIYKTNHE